MVRKLTTKDSIQALAKHLRQIATCIEKGETLSASISVTRSRRLEQIVLKMEYPLRRTKVP